MLGVKKSLVSVIAPREKERMVTFIRPRPSFKTYPNTKRAFVTALEIAGLTEELLKDNRAEGRSN